MFMAFLLAGIVATLRHRTALSLRRVALGVTGLAADAGVPLQEGVEVLAEPQLDALATLDGGRQLGREAQDVDVERAAPGDADVSGGLLGVEEILVEVDESALSHWL
jgi:hypothetical protein